MKYYFTTYILTYQKRKVKLLVSKFKKICIGNMPECNNFSKTYSRGWYDKKLYNDEKASSNKFSEKNIVVPIVLKIFGIV